MPENMMCKTHKANSQNFRDNFDRTFNSQVGACLLTTIDAQMQETACKRRLIIERQILTGKKEDPPCAVREHFYPEEIRARGIERRLKAFSSEDPKRKES